MLRRRGFNLLILVLVTSVIEEAITATTSRLSAPTRAPVRTAGMINQPWASISPLLRNTFDEGASAVQSQSCQCVMFYLCEEAITIANDMSCEAPLICCKPYLKLIPDNSATSSESAEFPSSAKASSESVPFSESSSPAASPESVESAESDSTASSTSPENTADHSSLPSTSTESSDNSNGGFVECGLNNAIDSANPIENSDRSVSGEFPWMVAILRTNETGDRVICGGSLLSPYVVLTTAHCLYNLDKSVLKIRAGDIVINTVSSPKSVPHQDRTVNSIIIHRNFSTKILHNDLALINVNEPFTYSSHIAPTCSPVIDQSFAASDSYDSQNCLVTGWKQNTENRAYLRKVSAEVITKSSCENDLRQTRLGRVFQLHSSFLCAKEKGSLCKGDGGGPLVCASRSNTNKYIQVGVVSWGVGCDIKFPGVYASLEANSEWITTEFNNLNTLRQV